MKHFFFIIIIFFGTVFCISSQNSEHINFSPEVALSLNINHQQFFGTQLGFGVGVFHAFYNQKKCNLILGLQYDAFIKRYDYFELGNFNHYNSFFGIPLLFRVNFGKKVKFFIEPGIFCDLIIFSRVKYRLYNSNEMIELYFDKPDFGVSGGIGLRIPINKYEILLKGNYKWGMKYLFNNSFYNSYNQYFRISVGFKANIAIKR